MLQQRLGVGRQVPMRQHRPLGPPRRPRGIEDRGPVVRPAGMRVLARGGRGGTLGQCPLPVRAKRQHRQRVSGPMRVRRLLRGVADEQPRCRVADEIVDLGPGIGGVQRQEDPAHLQRRQIQRDGLGRLLDLDGHAVAGRHARRGQRARQRLDHAAHPGKADVGLAGAFEQGLALHHLGGLDEMVVDGLHARLLPQCRHAFSASAIWAPSATSPSRTKASCRSSIRSSSYR